MVDICLAGTGGMMPLHNRWLTCCYMEYNGKAILIDCGEGTQIALVEADCKLSKLETLLITHFHADHVSGLPGLLLSLGNYSKTTPLKIYGPKGTTEIVNSLRCICGKLPYELIITEFPTNEVTDFKVPEIDDMISVRAFPLKHSVPCLGYSFVFSRKPVFNPQKAESLGLPKPMWKVLHGGGTVEFEGKTYTTEMVTDGERKPVKVTYATDSRPIDTIADEAFRADLFICEGMYGDDEHEQSMKEKGHMLISDAVRLAELAEAERLWFTHYSPAMTNPSAYEKGIKKRFPAAVISTDGQKITL
ncbi:ribonuclease Z [Ruminococcus sp. HUN007]|uniref:ribonuclease Z n=1 Tax=Ruminococcus sp. HUN007 TaxID=1514668 RepID=UPI0005D26501|nr:ribonuclease Z [Ruminococcus sp. HUN007]